MVFRRSCIKRCKFPVLCGNVPEILLCIVDKLEVSRGFFPISARSCGVILIWVEFPGEFHVSSPYLSFRYNLIHAEA